MNGCYCNSQKEFKDCCEPYIKGLEKAPTAEALMRSRYSAMRHILIAGNGPILSSLHLHNVSLSQPY